MCQLAVEQFRRIFVGKLHELVRRDADIGQAASIRGEVLADGEIEHGAVGEREGSLKIALAAGLRADDGGPIVFLQGGGEELRGGIAVLVDEDGHGQLDAGRVGAVGLFGPAIVLALEQDPLRQEPVEDLDELVLIAAAVIAHVEDQGLRAVIEQRVDGDGGLVKAASIEVGDLHVADLIVQHFIGGHGGLDAAAFDRQGQALAAAEDGQGHGGPLLPSDLCAGAGHAERERGLALDLGDDIADLHAGLLGRAAGGHLLDAHAAVLLLQGDGDADTDVGVLHLLVIAAFFLGGEVIAPAVAGRLDHGSGRRVGERVLVIVVDEKAVKVGADLRGLVLCGGTAAGEQLHRHDRRAEDGDGESEHEEEDLLPFFHDGYQPFWNGMFLGCLRRPSLFSRKRKDWGEKSAWLRFGACCICIQAGTNVSGVVPLGGHLTGFWLRAA